MSQPTAHWIGIDLHSNNLMLAAYRDQETAPVLCQTLPTANLPRLRRILKKLDEQAPVQAVYEAGGCGYVLARAMRRWGISCEVTAPSLIPRKPGDRVKTDKRDARKLATLYRAGILTMVHIPTEAEERLRALVRTHASSRGDVRRTKQRILKLLLARGHVYTGGKNWAPRFWAWLRARDLQGEDRLALQHHTAQLDVLEQLEGALARQVEERSLEGLHAEPVARLRCLRGVDTVTAMILATETVDMTRFASPRKYMGWLGLGVSELTSVRRRQGGITKTGNTRCRRVLTEAAWNNTHRPRVSKALKARSEGQPPAVLAHAWRAQKRLHTTWGRLNPRIGAHRTVTAMARQLAGFVWAIWRAEPQHLTPYER